jgi:hypothetical protein
MAGLDPSAVALGALVAHMMSSQQPQQQQQQQQAPPLPQQQPALQGALRGGGNSPGAAAEASWWVPSEAPRGAEMPMASAAQGWPGGWGGAWGGELPLGGPDAADQSLAAAAAAAYAAVASGTQCGAHGIPPGPAAFGGPGGFAPFGFGGVGGGAGDGGAFRVPRPKPSALSGGGSTLGAQGRA